jgi:hypothetical protein
VFILTVSWKGGKNQWNASTTALKAGDKMLAASEGVGVHGLAKAGVVAEGSGEQIPATRREAPVAHMTVR